MILTATIIKSPDGRHSVGVGRPGNSPDYFISIRDAASLAIRLVEAARLIRLMEKGKTSSEVKS